MSNDTPIDPSVEKEIDEALGDEDIIGAGVTPGGESDKLPLVEGWFPGEDEWQGKTIISKREAIAHALSKNLPKAFPEIKPLEGFIEDSVNDLEMLLTSVEGRGREQQTDVLRAMWGAGSSETDEARSLAYTAIAGAKKDDD